MQAKSLFEKGLRMESASLQTVYRVKDAYNIRGLTVYALKANGFDAHSFETTSRAA
jgi:hypothetical protein